MGPSHGMMEIRHMPLFTILLECSQTAFLDPEKGALTYAAQSGIIRPLFL